jgi:hypothetical protein
MQQILVRFPYITNYTKDFRYHGKLKKILTMQESLWHLHTGRKFEMFIDGLYVANASWNFPTSTGSGGVVHTTLPPPLTSSRITQCISKNRNGLASEELQLRTS